MRFYISSDNIVTVEGLIDVVTNTYINDAVITGIVYRGTAPISSTVTFAYVTGSDGNYEGQVLNTVDISEKDGNAYFIIITVTSSGNKLTIKEKLEPVYKTSNN